MNLGYLQSYLPNRADSVAIMQMSGLLFALLATTPSHADIYKWRDAKGVMNYSDMPPPVSAQPIEKVKAQKLNPETPLTRADAYLAPETPAVNPRGDEKASTQAPIKAQNEEAATLKAMEERLKAKNCLAARANYRNYAVGGRMQNVTEAGERSYLSDAQIQEGLQQAQQEIDENCPRE